MAHYLLAVVEQFERDGLRLRAGYDDGTTLARAPSPYRSSIGSSPPTCRICGADARTYGSIAAVDYLPRASVGGGPCFVGLGRFVQDPLL